MKRAKRRGARGTGGGVVGVGRPLVIGGVAPGSTRRPPGSSRAGGGRLGRALSEPEPSEPEPSGPGRNPAPRAKPKAPAAKALERWENEGGKTRRPVEAGTGSPKRAVKKAKTKAKPGRPAVPAATGLDPARRRKAAARVKRSQIKRAGLESRLLGHVSASGKRNQARRDSKNG